MFTDDLAVDEWEQQKSSPLRWTCLLVTTCSFGVTLHFIHKRASVHQTTAAACWNALRPLVLQEENPQRIRRRSSGLQIYLESAEYVRNILSKMSVIDNWHYLTCPDVMHRNHLLFLTEEVVETPVCCDAAMKYTEILPRRDTTCSIYISTKHYGFIYRISTLIAIPF